MSTVVRLSDHSAAPVEGHDVLVEWLEAYTAGIKEGDYGPLRSLILIAESHNGELGCVTQSLGHMDTARLVGMLTLLVHRKADGFGQLDDFTA